jgi:hypothetical protein
MKLISSGNIKITPDIIAGGESGAIMNVILARMLANNAIPITIQDNKDSSLKE